MLVGAAFGFARLMTLTVPVVVAPGVRVGRHLRVVGVHRGVAGLRRTPALVADVELGADLDHVTRGVADGPALLDGPGRRVDGDHTVLAVDGGVHGRAVGGEHRLTHERVLGPVRRDRDDGGVGEGAVRVHGELAVAVGLTQPQLRTVGRVRGACLAHVVAADAQVRRRGVADELLHLPGLEVHDGQRDTTVGDRGREVAAVRADRRRHDLAVVDDQSVTDRLDDLVAGHDQALTGGLADLVGAEPTRGRVGDPGAGAGEGQSSGTGDHQADPATRATEESEMDLRVVSALASYLHSLSLPRGGEQVDGPVDLPKGVGCVPGRGMHQEVAVHVVRSVTVGDIPTVCSDVELVDGLPHGGGAGQVPGDDATPAVARAAVGDQAVAFVAGRGGLQLCFGDVGAVQLLGLQPIQVGERRRERALQLALLNPGAGRRSRDRDDAGREGDQCDHRQDAQR